MVKYCEIREKYFRDSSHELYKALRPSELPDFKTKIRFIAFGYWVDQIPEDFMDKTMKFFQEELKIGFRKDTKSEFVSVFPHKLNVLTRKLTNMKLSERFSNTPGVCGYRIEFSELLDYQDNPFEHTFPYQLKVARYSFQERLEMLLGADFLKYNFQENPAHIQDNIGEPREEKVGRFYLLQFGNTLFKKDSVEWHQVYSHFTPGCPLNKAKYVAYYAKNSQYKELVPKLKDLLSHYEMEWNDRDGYIYH